MTWRRAFRPGGRPPRGQPSAPARRRAAFYLQGHGYTPRFTVTFPVGQQRTGAVQWSPVDLTTMLSQGATKFQRPGITDGTVRGATGWRSPGCSPRPCQAATSSPRCSRHRRPAGRRRRAARRSRPRRRARPVHLHRRPGQGGFRRAGEGRAVANLLPGEEPPASTTAPWYASTASPVGQPAGQPRSRRTGHAGLRDRAARRPAVLAHRAAGRFWAKITPSAGGRGRFSRSAASPAPIGPGTARSSTASRCGPAL